MASSINLTLNNGSSSSTGLGQGLDIDSVVSQLLDAQRGPEKLWQIQQTNLQQQSVVLTTVKAELSDLTARINALKDALGAVTAKTANSSDENILTATAQSTAANGSHVIVINNLAATSSAYTDPTPTGGTLSAGSFSLQVGTGQAATVNVGSGTNTLDSLASYINSHTELGVTASVINDVTGSRLALISNTPGQPGNLTLTSSGGVGTPSYTGVGNGTLTGLVGGTATVAETFTLTATDATHFDVVGSVSGSLGTATVGSAFSSNKIGFTISAGTTDFEVGDQFTVATNAPPLNFHQIAGSNASLTVDGIPISSSSNTVSNVISGVTLNLIGGTAGSTVNVNVAPDTTAATQVVTAFVASYNTLITLVNSQFTPPAAGSAAPPLSGNSSLRLLQSNLLRDVTYSMDHNNGLVNLATLGVTMSNNGTLSVDSTKLNDAVVNHTTDFQNFFQSFEIGNTGWARNFGTDLLSINDSTQGPINVELKQNTATQKALTNQIDDFEDRLAVTEKQLIIKFSQINAALQQLPLLQNQIASMLGALPKSS